jgi:hypothetical protein
MKMANCVATDLISLSRRTCKEVFFGRAWYRHLANGIINKILLIISMCAGNTEKCRKRRRFGSAGDAVNWASDCCKAVCHPAFFGSHTTTLRPAVMRPKWRVVTNMILKHTLITTPRQQGVAGQLEPTYSAKCLQVLGSPIAGREWIYWNSTAAIRAASFLWYSWIQRSGCFVSRCRRRVSSNVNKSHAYCASRQLNLCEVGRNLRLNVRVC